MSTTERKKTLHPIIMIDYIPRLVGHVSGFAMVASTLYTRNVTTWIPYTLIFLQAFAWPHLALFLSTKSKNPKNLELHFLLVDSFFCGGWIAYLNFASLPSVALIACIMMGQMSVGGLSLAGKGFITSAIGAGLVLAFHGIHYQPQTSVLPSVISIVVLLSFNATMGYITYNRAANLKQAKNKLRIAYLEVDSLNKILRAASSTLDLTKIMQQISTSLSVFFSFNCITLQIVNEERNELFFKALYNLDTGDKKGDISIVHPKLNYGTCLSVKAFIDNDIVFLPELTPTFELSYIDKNLLEIIGFKSVLYVPLSVEDHKIGVIGFYKSSKMVLTERTLSSIKLQLSHISLIINNAILYEDIKQKPR